MAHLKVQSRTCNASADGTFGQGFAGCALQDGLTSGEFAWLPQLTENAAFRTNIALVNVGASTASANVALYDGSGVLLGSYDVQVAPGVWKQTTQPFATKAGNTDLENGFAKVTVTSGSGVFAFASLTDNVTNDPTTIAMQR